MKICTMVFVGLLLEASLFASEKKGIQDNGIKGEKSGITTILYSSYDLLQARGSSNLTVEEQQQEESLICKCLKAYEDKNAILMTSHDPKIEGNKKFKQENREIIAISQSEKEKELQRKVERVKAERQKHKDEIHKQMLKKKEGYAKYHQYKQSSWRKYYDGGEVKYYFNGSYLDLATLCAADPEAAARFYPRCQREENVGVKL